MAAVRASTPWIAAGFVLAAAIASILLTRPPAPRPADAPASEFSAGRAMVHVERIARERHPAGSPAQGPVRTYLLETLRGLGLDPKVVEAHAESVRYEGTVRNVVARRAGARGAGAVCLVAHYDSVPKGPGAADDAASVAAILETLRALREGPTLANDLVVLLTDGEEMGLLGAWVFAGDEGRLKDIGVVLNFEARGNAGPTLMFETSDGNGRLVEEYAAAAPRPGANSLMAGVYRRMPNDTDFTVFRRAGVPGLNFAFIEGYTAYHMPSDTAANLSQASLQHQGETMLAVVRRFGGLDLRDLRGEDAVYFDVLGAWVVRYPIGLAWPLTAAAALLFAFGVVRGSRRGALRMGALAAGAGLLVATLVASCAASLGISQAILHAFPSRVSEPARGTAGDPWFFVAMTFVAVAVSAWTCRRFAPRLGAPNLAAGALLVWLVLLVAANAALPGGTFLFLVPLVFGSTSLVVRIRAGNRPPLAYDLALGPVLAVIVAAPMAQRLFEAMTLVASPVAVALVSLLLGAVLPVLEPLVAGDRRRLPLAALLAAAVSIGVGVFAV